ncbi:class E basic helix-loop-helix protein 22-like isoform X2 [Xiphophorus couchianus]|uniref:class E basic helix-loop-helix protein 22-like isoform X2 n=1 Tax=Xiphophorus couchianus TaxID=32473 RepID=UPI0010161CC8|nr:class E basic helix-loop-helix protein 22-like isoform X2 [Xiphophorus couchianus]
MPKNRNQNRKQPDLELTHFLRHPPVPPPHPQPTSPCPSPPTLPNVPSYPRLLPIASPPRPISGLANPAFFIEEDSDGPAEPSLSLRPAVSVEDVDQEGGAAGGGRGGGGAAGGAGGGGDESSSLALDPKLSTLTVPVAPAGGRQSRGDKDGGRKRPTVWTKTNLQVQSEDDDEEVSIPVRAWPSESSLPSANGM